MKYKFVDSEGSVYEIGDCGCAIAAAEIAEDLVMPGCEVVWLGWSDTGNSPDQLTVAFNNEYNRAERLSEENILLRENLKKEKAQLNQALDVIEARNKRMKG